MTALPTGTVTFLFTDIEGSTALLQRLGDLRYAEVLEEHFRLLRAAFAEGNGQEVGRQGDAFLVAFSRARDAVGTGVAAQLALTKHAWPDGASLRVRMGLHTGEPLTTSDDYVGLDVHRAARICAAGHGGQILLSQAVRSLAASDLPPSVSLRDLGARRLKDLREPEYLFQVVHPDLPSDFPPLKSLDVQPNNLPVQLTSFIGRERQKGEVRRLLSASRCLTLTGSGGAGKTRLALQVAAEALEEFPDGVWLVELAVLSDPTLVPQAVASALGVTEQPSRSMMDTLREGVRDKSMLVLLDNCEHVVAACAHLTIAVLKACPNLRILATSREALGVTGEITWRVPPLSLPDPQNLPPLDRFKKYEAVRLFTDRAVASAPQFAVTRSTAPAVAKICHRLDGIPLAIELAAARVKVLAVEQIAARLDDRFRLLTGGGRAAVLRQQTLRAAMDWSFDLLSEAERLLLRRLSVFAGGWTLEAAEAVCSRNGVDASDILDLLTQLVDKSLVIAETRGGEARHRLLETVRQYGRERLVEAKEEADIRRLHRDWYLDLAEGDKPRRSGQEHMRWLERLETEHDNLRAALEWSLGSGDPQAALRLAAAAFRLWWRGHFDEGRHWLEVSLAVNDKSPSLLRAKALVALGDILREQGEYRRAAEVCGESLRLYREWGDERGIADVLEGLGRLAWRRSDYQRATAFFEESLALNRKLGRESQVARSFNALGNVAHAQGDYQRAAAFQRESVALHRALNDEWDLAVSLDSLGNAEWRRGDDHRAMVFLEESLVLFRKLAFKRGIAVALLSIGAVALSRGHYERAKESFEESLALRRELGDRRGVASVLDKFGDLAQSLDRRERAAQLFGAAEAIREGIGAPLGPSGRADRERGLAAVRAGLGDAAFAAAWAAGRAMTLEQAAEYALTSMDIGPSHIRKRRSPRRAKAAGSSPHGRDPEDNGDACSGHHQ
jgi:predicted ATPase/class 3 adenylate cyclase